MVQSALQAIPACTKVGESLQRQAVQARPPARWCWEAVGGRGPFHGFTSQWVLGSEPGIGVSFQAYGPLLCF